MLALCVGVAWLRFGKKFGDLLDAAGDCCLPVAIERSAPAILLGELQHREQHVVAEAFDLLGDDGLLGDLRGLARVACEQSLVDARMRQHGWFTAKQNVEELELRDMATEDDEAHRQRCREEKADRLLEKRPLL